jgi:membrane protein DedA with SNARE-associated domain
VSRASGRRTRYLWVGPFIGFLLWVTGLLAEEVLDPVTGWLRDRSTTVVSIVVLAITALVIWILVRRERGRRRRIESVRQRVSAT